MPNEEKTEQTAVVATVAAKPVKVKMAARRKDINFFALRKTAKKKVDLEVAIPPWVISILIPSVAVAVVASIYIYNQSVITRMQNELAASQLQIEHANIDKQKPYFAKKTAERDIFATYYQWISELNSQFNYYQTVQSDIPNAITATAENLITISSFEAKNEKITINGFAKDMSAIAEFQRKCMEIEDIDNAFVSNIQRKEENFETVEYSFTFTASFKSRNNMMSEVSK